MHTNCLHFLYSHTSQDLTNNDSLILKLLNSLLIFKVNLTLTLVWVRQVLHPTLNSKWVGETDQVWVALDLCTTSSPKSSASLYQHLLHHNDKMLLTPHLWIKRNLDPGLDAFDLCTTSTQVFRLTTFQTYKSSSTLSNTWRQFRKNTSSQNRCIMLAGRQTPPCPTSSAYRKCFSPRQNTPVPLIAVISASPLNSFSQTNKKLSQKI